MIIKAFGNHALTGILAVALLSAAGCANEDGPRVEDPLTTDTAAMATAQTATTALVESGATIAVALEDKRIAVSSALSPGPVIFTIANTGTQLHSFAIEGGELSRSLEVNLEAGESGTLDVTLPEGVFVAYCPVLKHRDEGESVEIEVAR